MRTDQRFSLGAKLALVATVVVGVLAWAVLRSKPPSSELPQIEPPAQAVDSPQAPVDVLLRPEGERTKQASAAVPLAPAPQIVAQALPSIRFRVVDSNGAPVAGAKVALQMIGPPESKSSLIRGLANAEGKFEESRSFRSDCRSITVSLSLANGGAPRVHELAVPDPLPLLWDVGDLAIAGTRPITVQVHDQTDAPIAKAALSTSERNTHPVLTDSLGRADLALAPDVTKIEVAAPGFVTKRVDVPREAHAGQVLEVVLDTTCNLTVRVSSIPATLFEPTLSVSYPPIGAPPELLREMQRDGDLPRRMSGGVPVNGICFWRNLKAGLALHLEAKSCGTIIGSKDLEALKLGEQRFEELEIVARPQSLKLIVVGSRGEPVPDAWIHLRPSEGGQPEKSLFSDADGAARFSIYRPAKIDLCVSASGYATKEIHRVLVPDDQLRVELVAERTVEVQVVKLDGSSLTSSDLIHVYAPNNGNPGVGGNRASLDRWILRGLPEGEVAIMAGGSSILHDTAIPTARIVIGHTGSLFVDLDVDTSIQLDDWRVSLQSLSDPSYVTRAFDAGRPRSPRFLFQSLPPGRYELHVEHSSDSDLKIWQRWGKPSTVEIGDTKVSVTISD